MNQGRFRKAHTRERKGKSNIIGGMVLLYLFSTLYSFHVSQTFGTKIVLEQHAQTREVLVDHFLGVCSKEQKDIILHQLPEDACNMNSYPWVNQCSFSFASRCPNATWIENYYIEKATKRKLSIKDRLTKFMRVNEESSFLGISIGCNKGFDAINTIRMGTFDPIFDKEIWRQARQDETIDNRCGMKNDYSQFNFDSIGLYIRSRPHQRPRPRRGEMHCIEALPTNYNKLKRAAQELELDKKGFVVSHAAIAAKNGQVYFPDGEE